MSNGQSALKERLQEATKAAMRAKDKDRLGVIRMINAAIKQREVDERVELDDAQIVSVLDKMLKQRREAIEQFEKAGRDDLVAKEQAEAEVIQEFMPAALSETEIDQAVADAVESTGAASVKDMGKVMAVLKPQMQGRADMSAVSAKVKARLGG